jgi:hypothetical protein
MDATPITLDALGIQYGTDKSSLHHGYLDIYEKLFKLSRNEPIKLLEIGVLDGGSLKTWEAYFPHATIVGADINPAVRQYQTKRIEIAILDQSNLQNLVDIGIRSGPFDIIIEDGSHLWEHQTTTLKTLFPFLKPGGLYVVEDLQTNFGPLASRFRGCATISCVEYLKKLVDYRVGDEQVDIAAEEDSFLRTYGRSLGYVMFFRHACILEKSVSISAKVPKLAGQLIINTPDGNPKGFQIKAHVGKLADVVGDGQCCLNVPENLGGYIQGFELVMPPEFADNVSYRVRSSEGAWSSWTQGNVYAGTRGQSEDLTGFAIRVSGELAEDYSVAVAGQFKSASAQVVGNGQDCVGEKGVERLLGVQLALSKRSA